MAARVRLPPACARVASIRRRLNSPTAPWKPTTGLGGAGGGGDTDAAGFSKPLRGFGSWVVRAPMGKTAGKRNATGEGNGNSAGCAPGPPLAARTAGQPAATNAAGTGQIRNREPRRDAPPSAAIG